jgi:hypothetical protein
MSIEQDVFHHDNTFERRSIKRGFCGKSALLFFSSRTGVRPCYVRDATTLGAGIRLEHLTMLPVNFLLSFDKFRSVRACRLTWRDGDFVGVAFEN